MESHPSSELRSLLLSGKITFSYAFDGININYLLFKKFHKMPSQVTLYVKTVSLLRGVHPQQALPRAGPALSARERPHTPQQRQAMGSTLQAGHKMPRPSASRRVCAQGRPVDTEGTLGGPCPPQSQLQKERTWPAPSKRLSPPCVGNRRFNLPNVGGAGSTPSF